MAGWARGLRVVLLLQWSMDDSGQLHGDAVDALTLHGLERNPPLVTIWTDREGRHYTK